MRFRASVGFRNGVGGGVDSSRGTEGFDLVIAHLHEFTRNPRDNPPPGLGQESETTRS